MAGAAHAQAPRENGGARQIEIGFEQRIRNENWNNIFDYSGNSDDQRNQIRWRTRFWGKIPLGDNIDFVAGLNQETNQRFGQDNYFDEVIFETLYLDFKKLFVKGLSLRVGRQNFIKGEGFLILEGECWDGSRAIYQNGFDLAYARGRHKIELIGVTNPSRDRYLPRINDKQRLLTEWNEQAIGTYYTGALSKKTNLEGYYFLKKEFGDTRPRSNPQFQPDRQVHTLGARLVRQLPRGWSATGEFAGQWGEQQTDVKVRGWAGYGYLKKTLKHRWKPYVQAGYWGFSGDDPATKDRHEGWDPLFGRWPKWSELYIYSQFPEVGVGYWTNTSMWQGELGFVPAKRLGARFTYYHMDSFHPYTKNRNVFGPGTRRGENVQARLDIVANRYLKGHVLYEDQVPGDFYAGRGNCYFLRFEVIFEIKGNIPLPRKAH